MQLKKIIGRRIRLLTEDEYQRLLKAYKDMQKITKAYRDSQIKREVAK